MALGRALRKAGDNDAATAAFEKAAALVPIAHGGNSPHAQMAQMALEKNDRPRAIAELQALVDADFDNVEAARVLAKEMRQAGIDDPAKVRAVNERIAAIDPFDGEAHTVLGRLAMQRNDTDTATREFEVVLALGPLDPASANTDLAESLFKAGKTADAKKHTLAALEIVRRHIRAPRSFAAVGGDAPLNRAAIVAAAALLVTLIDRPSPVRCRDSGAAHRDRTPLAANQVAAVTCHSPDSISGSSVSRWRASCAIGSPCPTARTSALPKSLN